MKPYAACLALHPAIPRGDPRNPLSFDEIVEKFTDLGKGLLNEWAIEQIIPMIQNLEKMENISLLLKMCSVEDKTISMILNRSL